MTDNNNSQISNYQKMENLGNEINQSWIHNCDKTSEIEELIKLI